MNRESGLITNLGTKSPISEAYRTLRTNLEFMSPDEPLKTILFTSTGPGEGKSTTATNTAISMAQLGKKVLLIDCDLRKPVQHKMFNLSNMEGLTNALVDYSIDVDKFIQNTIVNNFDILTSGPIPPNPAELLGSQRMSKLLQSVLVKYDLIILDTPPIISVTDAAILTTITDGVILVVGAKIVDRDMLKKAKELLVKVKARILGVVLNRIEIEKNQEYYYYYESQGDSYAG